MNARSVLRFMALATVYNAALADQDRKGRRRRSLLRGIRKRDGSWNITRRLESLGLDKAQVFVKCKDKQGEEDTIRAAHNLISNEGGGLLVITADAPGIHRLLANEAIESIEEDHIVTGFSTDNQQYRYVVNFQPFGKTMGYRALFPAERELQEIIPYGISMIQADQVGVGPNAVTVCMIDSGIAMGHPDLNWALITGSDNTRQDGQSLRWDQDLDGHGTHISGTVAAIAGNGMGIRGIGSTIKLHITRGLDDFGNGYESDVRRAMLSCADNGAKIINLSLGGSEMASNMDALYTEFVEQRGIMLLAASGNEGVAAHSYPASHPSVISVGAVYPNGEWAPFSNYNDQVELMAPGYAILSTSVSARAVMTDTFSYPALQLGSKSIEITGAVKSCGNGGAICSDVSGAICLMQRDTVDAFTMIKNCQDGGGLGAILFWKQGLETDWYFTKSWIPAFVVSPFSGVKLIDLATTGLTVKLAFAGDTLEYTYDFFTGTSMATPHVAAAAAVVWSHFPECSNSQIRYALATTALGSGCGDKYGYGLVQIKAAYDYLAQRGCSFTPPKSTGGCSTAPIS